MVVEKKVKLEKYENLDKTELIQLVRKKDVAIAWYKNALKLYDEVPNKNIEMYISNLVIEVGTLFKLDIAEKIQLLENIRKTVNDFIR